MAKSTKGARNIVVDGVRYRWRATGNDEAISLLVWPDELPGPTIACSLGYHQKATPLGEGRIALTQQIVITARIVRQVILHALRAHAYDPRKEGTQLDLRRLDDAIDLSDAIRSD
jgi:hypothetical protein